MIETENHAGRLIADVHLVILCDLDFPGTIIIPGPISPATVAIPKQHIFVGWAEIRVEFEQADRIPGSGPFIGSGVSIGNENAPIVGTVWIFVDRHSARLPDIVIEIICVGDLRPILVTISHGCYAENISS